MTQDAKQQEEAQTIVVSNDSVITLAGIRTGRRFQVIGADETAEKFLALLTYLVDAVDPKTGLPMDHNIRNIVLNNTGLPIDSDGNAVLGLMHYTSGSVIINQGAHIDACFSDVAKPTFFTQFRAHVWIQLLQTAAHEITHAAATHFEVMKGNVKAIFKDQDDDAVEAVALAVLIDMAKTIDMEAPDLDEWFGMGQKIAQLEQSFQGGKEGWQAAQSMMLTDKAVYMDIANDHVIDDIRGLMAGWAKADITEWPKDITVLSLCNDQEPTLAECKADIAGADTAVEPTAEEMEKAKADAEAAVQKARDEKTAAMKEGFVMQFKAACGMDAEAEVDDATLSIYLLGRGIDINDLERLANEVHTGQETLATVNADGSGEVIVGADEQYAAGGVDGFEVDDYDDPSGTGYNPTVTPGMGVPSPPLDPQAIHNQAIANNAAAYNVQAPAPAYPPHQLDPASVKQVIRQVYEAVAEHIFGKCGWQAMQVQNPGQQPFNLYQFTNPTAVMEPVCLSHIPNIERVIVAMDCLDERGSFTKDVPVIVDQSNRIWVKGSMVQNKTIPCYTLTFNFGDGVARKRFLVPQNPNKVNGAGQLSKYALDARAGHKYYYIIDKTLNAGIIDSCKDGRWQS